MGKKGTTNPEIEKVEKIELSGEIVLRERIDEDTKEKRYSVAVAINNPFAELFEGGVENEYNRQIFLAFKDSHAKIKAQFNYKAKKELMTCEKIEFSGFVQRKRFYDETKFKWVRYIGIFINNPFDDGVITLTIPRAETLGLFEMFADERLLPAKK
ncbi:MAG: hypothetical protein FWD58_10785 [Firmicutes bacterium]|nr:hypothetical protein [Bacillota bacterium]